MSDSDDTEYIKIESLKVPKPMARAIDDAYSEERDRSKAILREFPEDPSGRVEKLVHLFSKAYDGAVRKHRNRGSNDGPRYSGPD